MSQKTPKITLGDVITQKDVTDAIFKNLTWYLACGALLKFTIALVLSGNWLLALVMFLTFIGLFILNMVFGANHILMPIDAGLGRTLDQLRQQNATDEKNSSKLKRTFGFMFGSLKGWTYFCLSCIYVAVTFQLVGLAASSFPPSNEHPKVMEMVPQDAPTNEKHCPAVQGALRDKAAQRP